MLFGDLALLLDMKNVRPPGCMIQFQEVCCVPMSCQDHVACVLPSNCMGMSRGIIQKLLFLFNPVLSWVCLLCGNGPQSCKHSAVYALCIIEESADDLLDDFLPSLGISVDVSASSAYCAFAPCLVCCEVRVDAVVCWVLSVGVA
jgi:hypothetical protein